MLCWAEPPAQPISTARPASATAEWKGQMWSQTVLTGDWFFPLCPAPSSKLFLFPYGLFLLSTKSKEEQQENYSGRVGETSGRESTKGKPQRFSVLRMVRDQSTLICLSVPGGMIKGRKREGDVIIIFLKISWYRINFKEIPDPLDGKIT